MNTLFRKLWPRKPDWFYRQSAVLPFRTQNGELEILLITSSSGKHWVIPKGIIEPDMSPAASAVKEAYEEAGIRGTVHPQEIGTYRYAKWGGTCEVVVYLLEVAEVLPEWPEQEIRQRQWLRLDQAAQRVHVDALRQIILGSESRIAEILERK